MFSEICTSDHSKIFKVSILNNDCYVKRFLYFQNDIYNGFDLSLLYRRDRLKISLWGQKYFGKISLTKEYVSRYFFGLKKINILFNFYRQIKAVNLSEIIKEVKDENKWIRQINKLTKILLKINNEVISEVPTWINDIKIWELKKQLQLIKPLSHVFNKSKVNKLVLKLGKTIYIAHGDLQPKNLLLKNDGLEIIDFEECFVAPKHWDVGFLWGNLLYESVKYQELFYILKKYWLFFAKKNNNFVIISLSVCLMRIYMFPVFDLKNSQKKQLVEFCRYYLNKL